MKHKAFITGIIGLLGLVFALGTGCSRHYLDMTAVEEMVRMENPVYLDKPIPKHVVEELAFLIDGYHRRITAYADDAEQLQLLYKNMAQRYLDIGYYEQQIEYYTSRIQEEKNPPGGADRKVYFDYAAIMLMQRKLYANAYENMQESLKLSPDNAVFLYYSGYCAALIGKATRPENETEGLAWIEKAVKYYQQAIQVSPDYIEALYGISIIQVYELGQPEKAIPTLIHIRSKSPENTDARFVLAAAYAMTGDNASAISEYTEIERITTSDEKKKAARDNIAQLRSQ